MQDLPIGFDADGADAWAFQDVLADGISVGAPPDEFNTQRPELGAAAVRSAQAARRRLPAVHRDDPRAACATRAGCASITSWGCSACSGSRTGMEPKDGAYVRSHAARPAGHRRAREPARPRGHRRRGSRHGRGGDARRAGAAQRAVVPAALVREERRRRSIPEQALARGHDARSADDCRAVDRLRRARRRSELGLAPNEAGHPRDPRPREAAGARPAADPLAARRSRACTRRSPPRPRASSPPRWTMRWRWRSGRTCRRPPTSGRTGRSRCPEPIESLEKNRTAARIARMLSKGRRRGRGETLRP